MTEPRGRSKGVRVTCVDLDTGESESVTVKAGDYVLIPVEPCYRASVQAHGNGTHVITVKGRLDGTPLPEPDR
jgi:hypothetical protein